MVYTLDQVQFAEQVLVGVVEGRIRHATDNANYRIKHNLRT